MWKTIRWPIAAFIQRLNCRKTLSEIIRIGKDHGMIVMLLMITTELIESLVIPILLFRAGHPEMIPLALAIHTEPLVLAAYFGINKWIN
ncbi:hypothetical protein Poly51_35080 [Rubripirellula tenax]|uniref:Uncharacterized protein n=1 Tax=Rubripirellula tenax TaxID=2528015 RepID=A0A5C6F4P5_9BACT|nr:hypothetical protein [Rubripirellula tenax]TWU54789.1 hypothetical protein Poly51_35080 [Rubripirellula tenax]